jgi:hypothetical protein
MESFSHGRTSQQFRFLRRQFLQDGKLPFTNVLKVETITHAFEKVDTCWKDRNYTSLVTLWDFPASDGRSGNRAPDCGAQNGVCPQHTDHHSGGDSVLR